MEPNAETPEATSIGEKPGTAGAVTPPPADAAAPPALADAFESAEAGAEYWYEESGGDFWLRNRENEWIGLGVQGFTRELKKLGKRSQPAPILSAIEEVIRDVEQNHRVEMAGVFAGWPCGRRVISGRRVLVTRELPKIEPAPGEWPTLRAFFEGLFIGEEPGNEEGGAPVYIDQTDWFYGWLQHAMQCYQENLVASGLALCVAGEPNSGKSRLAMILEWLLGERVAKPYAFMIGRDNFNRDMFEAVLQLVDDETADTRLDARLKFAAEIKKVVANDAVKQRGMHKDGFAVNVLRRLVVLVNLEANRLMVLPPIDDDVADKLIMLKGYRRPQPDWWIDADTPWEKACWPMPMPTRTPREQAALRARWRAELPAFLHWLLFEYKMPSRVSGGRFGVRHWHHPQILERLNQFSPHVRCWQLIESSRVVFNTLEKDDAGMSVEWVPRPEWRGTARELHELLTGESSRLTVSDKRSVATPEWLGQRLESCCKHFGPDVCRQRRTNKRREWILRRKEGLCD